MERYILLKTNNIPTQIGTSEAINIIED